MRLVLFFLASFIVGQNLWAVDRMADLTISFLPAGPTEYYFLKNADVNEGDRVTFAAPAYAVYTQSYGILDGTSVFEAVSTSKCQLIQSVDQPKRTNQVKGTSEYFVSTSPTITHVLDTNHFILRIRLEEDVYVWQTPNILEIACPVNLNEVPEIELREFLKDKVHASILFE